MSLHLGLFHQFKGADTVLLSGTPNDVAELSAHLRAFASSDALDWAVHDIAHVSIHNPAQLFACRTPQLHATGFVWVCSPESMSAIQGKLQALASSGSGHQYFGLLGSSVQLAVSVGEYGESWWSAGA
jgi:hypothetical protein